MQGVSFIKLIRGIVREDISLKRILKHVKKFCLRYCIRCTHILSLQHFQFLQASLDDPRNNADARRKKDRGFEGMCFTLEKYNGNAQC